MKRGQNIFRNEILDEFENKLCRIKNSVARSNLRKARVRSRRHIFSLIIMKLDQNVCPNEMLDDFENGSCWVKNLVTRQNLRKTLCTH